MTSTMRSLFALEKLEKQTRAREIQEGPSFVPLKKTRTSLSELVLLDLSVDLDTVSTRMYLNLHRG